MDDIETIGQIEKDIQLRVYEHCKSLYSEENYRRERLNDAVKVYVGFLTFVLGLGAFKAFSVETFISLFNDTRLDGRFVIFSLSLFSISVLSFFVSLVYTILILKTWKFSMLGDPEEIAVRSHLMTSEHELIAAIIGHYIVAINTNHKINNSKARLLSHALFFLILGLVIFVLSLFAVNGITVLGGISSD